MDLKSIKQLVKIFEDSTINELEVEEEGLKVRLSRNASAGEHNNSAPFYSLPMHAAPMAFPETPQDMAASQEAASAVPASTPQTESKTDYHEIRSPMVGTFYRSPAPDADSYVQVGSRIQVGQTLCIVEAMKLMNEIESEVSGVVKEILIDNSKPVEYNQTLFLVDTSA